MSKFSENELKQLSVISAGIEMTARLSARAQALRWEKMTTDEFERSICNNYREQVDIIHQELVTLADLLLEQNSDADLMARQLEEDWKVLAGLQRELSAIVNFYFERCFGTQQDEPPPSLGTL